jgi:hypothetical protein
LRNLILSVAVAAAALAPPPSRADVAPPPPEAVVTGRDDTGGEPPDGLTLADVLGQGVKVDPDREYRILRRLHWTDRGGENVAVFVSARKYTRKGEDVLQHVALYVTTFRFYRDRYNLVQDIREVVEPCALDLTAGFVDAATQVSDADGDGEGELTFVYRFGCGGDVSPNTQKLLMLEGKSKQALRGETRVDPGSGVRIGGGFKPDFGKAPPALLAHATRVWQAHVDEN